MCIILECKTGNLRTGEMVVTYMRQRAYMLQILYSRNNMTTATIEYKDNKQNDYDRNSI